MKRSSVTGNRESFGFVACLLTVATLVAPTLSAQQCDEISYSRTAMLGGGFVLGQGIAIAIQRDTWWTTPTTAFHLSDRVSASKGQDYLLHAAVSYHASQLGGIALHWACVPSSLAPWLGAAFGFAISLPKEIGDGFHEDQGFSLRDALWSAAGAALPALHHTWAPSRAVLLKGNYWPSSELLDRTGAQPTLFTDYAGQRYFLAFDPGRLPGGGGPWPDWLGIAVGHGVPHWITVPPEHEWYVTLDLNLRGLAIDAPWWPRLASVLDQIKWPMPGVRVRSGEVAVGLF
ncbi:MAG: DUF2279 domain-containing protein [Gemmatimonadales bacterium]